LFGEELLIAFGSFEEGAAKAVAIGAEVVEALQDRGLAAMWSGLPEERVRLPPFKWRRRRWTQAPPRPAVTRSPEVPVTRSLSLPVPGVARLLAVPDALQPDQLEQYVQPVVAVRSSAGFRLQLANIYKTLWKKFGGVRGQMCHAGLPHIFVPAGEQTSMIVRNAYLNLRPDEIASIFERALQARVRDS
jgi:hypothetical protein